MKRGYVLLFAIFGSWIALDLLAWIYGVPAQLVLREFVIGTWGTGYGIGQIFFRATPLLFTGLSVRIALSAGLFNVGGEGQLTMASLALGAVGATLPASVFFFPILLVVALSVGALWALLPAFFSRKGGGGLELLATILMNRLADPVVALALHAGLGDGGTTRTRAMHATLPRLDRFIPALSGSAVSVAAIFAFLFTAGAAAWLSRARIAREWTFIRENRTASDKVGIPSPRRFFQAMLASGAVAGLVSLGTVAGAKGYFEQGLGAGAGFTGIGVALLGGESTLGLFVAALLFGTLAQGGLAINALLPREIFQLFEAGIIVFVAFLSGEAWKKFTEARART